MTDCQHFSAWRRAAGSLMTTALCATTTKQALFSMAATCLQMSKSKYQSWQISLCVCLARRDRTMRIWPGACGCRNWAAVIQWERSLRKGTDLSLIAQKHWVTGLFNLTKASHDSESSANCILLLKAVGFSPRGCAANQHASDTAVTLILAKLWPLFGSNYKAQAALITRYDKAVCNSERFLPHIDRKN